MATVAPAAPGRFVPNEIIVKFRAQAADTQDAAAESLQSDLRVRQIRSLVGPRGPRRLSPGTPASLSDRLSIRERRLVRRQERAGASDVPQSPGQIYRIKLDADAGLDLQQVLAEYRNRPDVEFAELNSILSICVAPSDPAYAEQWSLAKIGAADAWDTCRGDSEVVVAIVDTGVDYNHRDLQGNLWVNEAERNGEPGVDDDGNGYVDDIHGYNFIDGNNDPDDDHGHGTHVAGIVAAAGNNGLDAVGVCWTARIMPLKILGADGEGDTADAVPAIYYAVDNGADIISGSWGGEEGSDALRDAIDYAHRHGVLVVAAAGNDNSDALYYPAAYPHVIAVAATDSADRRWYMSNYGSWVDIAAPGRDVVSLSRGVPDFPTTVPLTMRLSGTSMAAPHVAGACALLLSANPFLTCDELQEILTTTADPIAAGIDASNGRLNVYEALRAAVPAAGALHLDRGKYADQAQIDMFLADWDLRGAASQVVLVTAESGDAEAVLLMETEVSLGMFRGSLQVHNAPVTPADGILQVQDGQAISVRYLDGEDGVAQASLWREATALADFTPPVVLDVKIELRGLAATINLLTDEPARAEIRYGKAGAARDLAETEWQSGDLHAINLNGLTAQTTYCFVIAATDEAGNEAIVDNAGQPYSFRTSGRLRAARLPIGRATIPLRTREPASR